MNDRITTDPAVMGGAPCVRGLRVTASAVAGLMAAGRDDAEILAAYPYLDAADLDAVRAWRDDLAALAELLAWQRAGRHRTYSLVACGADASVRLYDGSRKRYAEAPTVREAVRAALAAWGEG